MKAIPGGCIVLDKCGSWAVRYRRPDDPHRRLLYQTIRRATRGERLSKSVPEDIRQRAKEIMHEAFQLGSSDQILLSIVGLHKDLHRVMEAGMMAILSGAFDNNQINHLFRAAGKMISLENARLRAASLSRRLNGLLLLKGA